MLGKGSEVFKTCDEIDVLLKGRPSSYVPMSFTFYKCSCENNWIRRIAGVERVERRRMKDLREEVGTKACTVGRIVKSRMK